MGQKGKNNTVWSLLLLPALVRWLFIDHSCRMHHFEYPTDLPTYTHQRTSVVERIFKQWCVPCSTFDIRPTKAAREGRLTFSIVLQANWLHTDVTNRQRWYQKNSRSKSTCGEVSLKSTKPWPQEIIYTTIKKRKRKTNKHEIRF